MTYNCEIRELAREHLGEATAKIATKTDLALQLIDKGLLLEDKDNV